MSPLTECLGYPYPRPVPPLRGLTAGARAAALTEMKLQVPRRRLGDDPRVSLTKAVAWSTCLREGRLVCTCPWCSPPACGGTS